MDVHTRTLRSFAVLAEELNFSRAAARLFVTQQALSKQIKSLEDEFGAELFCRSTRSVELTTAGEHLVATTRTALEALDEGVATARNLGAAMPLLRVGVLFGAALELTAPLVGELVTTLPDLRVEHREYPLCAPTAGLDEGWADVAVIRPPLSTVEVDYEPLFVEPRVAALASAHPLATRTRLSVSDLQPHRLVNLRSTDPTWDAFWRLDDALADRCPPLRVRSHVELLAAVSRGTALAVLPACVARYLPHPNVRFVPIQDAQGSIVAVAWPRQRFTAAVERVLDCARTVCSREHHLIDVIEQPFDRSPALAAALMRAAPSTAHLQYPRQDLQAS